MALQPAMGSTDLGDPVCSAGQPGEISVKKDPPRRERFCVAHGSLGTLAALEPVGGEGAHPGPVRGSVAPGRVERHPSLERGAAPTDRARHAKASVLRHRGCDHRSKGGRGSEEPLEPDRSVAGVH